MDQLVYVVMDTKGAGRIVGVFERMEQADEIQEISPRYYRMYPMHLNEVNPDCVRWAQDDEGRAKLERLSTQTRAIED